jgi:hypothetical protein
MPPDITLATLTREHGLPVRHGNDLLFADGTRFGDYIVQPPPADPNYRRRCQRLYHRILLDTLEQEGAKLEAALIGRGEPWRYPREGHWLIGFIGPPAPRTEEGGREMLNRINALANRTRAALHDIDRQLPPPILGSA